MSNKIRGNWICIDGTEGAGKTTLTGALAECVPSVTIGEFSRAPFGTALRDAVAISPHYISESPVGQSLVFLGDFIELYDSRIAPALAAGETVLTDRGWLSKYAYQSKVLQRTLNGTAADALLRHILGLIPRPDFCVLLSAPLDVIRARLTSRDGHCDEDRLAFIADAAALARRFALSQQELCWTALDTDRPRREVLSEALARLRADGLVH